MNDSGTKTENKNQTKSLSDKSIYRNSARAIHKQKSCANVKIRLKPLKNKLKFPCLSHCFFSNLLFDLFVKRLTLKLVLLFIHDPALKPIIFRLT